MVIDGLIREMRKSFDETGHLFRMFLVFRSRRGVGTRQYILSDWVQILFLSLNANGISCRLQRF